MHMWYVKEETKDGFLLETSNNMGIGEYGTSATLMTSVLLCSMFQLMKK